MFGKLQTKKSRRFLYGKISWIPSVVLPDSRMPSRCSQASKRNDSKSLPTVYRLLPTVY